MTVTHCNNCPRQCAATRRETRGFCNAGDQLEVASIAIHRGEEPPLSGKKGVCNVFFAHCNLQCCYCQNYEISRGSVDTEKVFYHSISEVVDRIQELLPQTENVVGLVSPTHYADSVIPLIEAIHDRGLSPTIVYNTNGYDSVEVLQQLAPYIDIYLPDFKYMDSDLAFRYSSAADYPEKAQLALLEMYSQKGASLPTDENDIAFRGMIVRHLVLPGAVQNSIDCLRWLADNLGTRIHISLMAQYFPPQTVGRLPDELNRRLTKQEYQQVVDEFYRLGFSRGWVQELDSSEQFHPDFSQRQSFQLMENKK